MRTWGRVNGQWVAVESDANGDFSYGWLTTLIQTLKLNLGESPFYPQAGIPAQQCIVTQIAPDYYVNLVQQQFSPYFSTLSVTKDTSQLTPTYTVDVVFRSGERVYKSIAV